MSILSVGLSLTVGQVFSKYRTLGQWAKVYCQVIDGLPVTEKTKANRKCSLAHILAGLGESRTISAIRPHDISGFVMRVCKDHPPLAKRVLIEAKAIFNEAMNYAWIDRNPAIQVKAQRNDAVTNGILMTGELQLNASVTTLLSKLELRFSAAGSNVLLDIGRVVLYKKSP